MGAVDGVADMRDQLEERLGELRAEYDAGRKMLAELEAKQAELQETLLRISGAIQVVEELLAANPAADADGNAGNGGDGASSGP
jgi:predicted nuclease with TOPRIM domain